MKKPKPLRIAEALVFADAIKLIMDDFVDEIENGRDDPENDVVGWKDTDLIVASEHMDERSVALIELFRTLNK